MEFRNVFLVSIFIFAIGFSYAALTTDFDNPNLPHINIQTDPVLTTIIITGNLTNFTALEDTPSTYISFANKCAAVNPAEDGLEFVDCGSGGGGNSSWNQTFAETLFTDIEFNYNQTQPALDAINNSFNATYTDDIYLAKLVNHTEILGDSKIGFVLGELRIVYNQTEI